jgi:hypothetical protein
VSLSAIPKALREAVFQRDQARCRYCQLLQFGQASVFHINHIIPRSKGGTTTTANLALQCPHCSLRKSDKVDGLDTVLAEMVSLFHPLEMRWDEHFALAADGTCVGRTPIGRVTVAELRMNDPLPRTARLVQIMIGLLPASI